MEQMLEAYAAAVRAKDVDAFMDLYADDTRNFDLWNEWSYDGKDALRGMVAVWFGSLADDEEVVVEWDDVRSLAGEGVGGLSAFLTYSAVSSSGETLRSMNNRLTWVLRMDGDGAWQIAHEHTSAPAGDGGKVQLQR
jgi:uncharacterized protein (TIGR02246 family)